MIRWRTKGGNVFSAVGSGLPFAAQNGVPFLLTWNCRPLGECHVSACFGLKRHTSSSDLPSKSFLETVAELTTHPLPCGSFRVGPEGWCLGHRVQLHYSPSIQYWTDSSWRCHEGHWDSMRCKEANWILWSGLEGMPS